MSVPSTEPALFSAFPALAAGLPRCVFLRGPTPVQRLSLEGVPEGQLFVKRDDLSCSLYGGNKPRKLEFMIGRALERRSRRLVTTGGLGTNHGLATTILAREEGLETTLVLIDQPVTPAVRESLLLFVSYGAEVVYGGNVPGAAVATLRVLLRATLAGERPMLVPSGGSSPLGNLGFVSAGLELGRQVEAGELPEPAQIFVPVGSGGTLAGLVLGLRLAGLATRVVGVRVSDILPPSPRRLARAAGISLRMLRRIEPSIPDRKVSAGDFDLIADQLGPGYGAATPQAERAVRAAADRGVVLETTYTGKCLAEVIDRARRGALLGPVLFWNTYNSVDVTTRAPRRAAVDELSAPIQRILRQEGPCLT